MTFFEQALQADLTEDYRAAIELYSKSVDQGETIADAHLNLIVALFDVCHEYGTTSFLINKKIYTQDEILVLTDYLTALMEKSIKLFDSNEFVYWKYYADTYWDQTISRDRVWEIIEMNPSSLVPYYQLYLLDKSYGVEVTYQDKIETLRVEVTQHKTIKNRYILSFIESSDRDDFQGWSDLKV